MPIYEYRCSQCRRKSTHLFRSLSDTHTPTCSHCGSPDLARLMSTFALHRSWDPGPGFPSSETLGDFDENDPKSAARWIKGIRHDMGDAFGNEYDGMIERMEAGELADEEDTADSPEI